MSQLDIQGQAGLEETHPVCRRENRHLVVQSVQNAVFFGNHFMHNLGCVKRWHVVRLAPAQSIGESREKVGKRTGRLPRLLRIWPQGWSLVWVPGGVQFNANVSRCRKGEDISLLNVGALGLRPTPVGEVQQLQCEKRVVGPQINRGVEIAQEVSALAPVGPLNRCGGSSCAERHS